MATMLAMMRGDTRYLTGLIAIESSASISASESPSIFESSDVNEAMGFVTRVALAAERADHHPDIDIRWNKVTTTLSTHSEGGITQKDLDMADKIEELV